MHIITVYVFEEDDAPTVPSEYNVQHEILRLLRQQGRLRAVAPSRGTDITATWKEN